MPAPVRTIAPINPTQFNDEEFVALAREHRRAQAPQGIEKLAKQYAEAGKLSLATTASALKILHTMNGTDWCDGIYQLWRSRGSCKEELWKDPESGVALVKLLCRANDISTAETLAGLYDADADSLFRQLNGTASAEGAKAQMMAIVRQEVIGQLALGHTTRGEFKKALIYVRLLSDLQMTVDLEVSKKVLKGFLREASLIEALRCQRLLATAGGLTDNDSIQLVTNTFLKELTFVTGAVSMETLPVPALPEVVFMGRSNVGKSSLINMITNKKHLAYTSKRAGKTKEFNYFQASGAAGGLREPTRFHIVDLPGVGYAEQSKRLKAVWLDFQKAYAANRQTLKCVFHLIDSRHGVMDMDAECFSLLHSLPDTVRYVVVFTKTDKRGSLPPEILAGVQRELRKYTTRDVPIVYTSSETKMGGVEVLTIILEGVCGYKAIDSHEQHVI